MKKVNELFENIDKIHTTELGVLRIQKNLELSNTDVIAFCKDVIFNIESIITNNGKNWYVSLNSIILTINRYSYTIITAHKIKESKDGTK